MESNDKKERVIAYVDGFNLYFGMKEGRHNDTLWLNVQLLAKNLLKTNQELALTKYFTSRVRNNSPKEKRQNTYIEAIETLADCRIYYGHYQSQIEQCDLIPPINAVHSLFKNKRVFVAF
ncbi:MAG TPA: NYN domain-containing protein, partial [Puia sp.]|nr:NYN domain-containing protein [Puia sp.]